MSEGIAGGIARRPKMLQEIEGMSAFHDHAFLPSVRLRGFRVADIG